MSRALTFFRCVESGAKIIVLGFSVQDPSKVKVEAEPTPFINVRLVFMLLVDGNRIEIEDVGSV